MIKVNTKRQITLPLELCKAVQIQAGDEIETFVYHGQITLVKKITGAAKGLLHHLEIDHSLSDEQSLQSRIDER